MIALHLRLRFPAAALWLAVFATSKTTRTNGLKFDEPAVSPVEMVVSANNLATDAGKAVLARGGSAVDAMIAVQTVLGLVEPQSSGIAGGAFVVYYSASEERLTTFDAREKAPSLATEERFILDGEEMDFNDAWQSALSVGVPGVPMLMQDLHDKYGVLEWSTLFDDAIRIATDGWEQTQRTEDNANELLELNEDCLEPLFFRDLVAADFFLDLNSTDCPMAKPAGTLMTNPAYAATMMALAEGGAAAFYSGEIAEAIVAKVAADRNPTGDAILTFQDLASYEVIEREPLCQPYRDFGEICGMPPPSSGGLALGQIFGILENFELADDPWDVTTIHLFTQAMRLAFADRNLYVGDEDFIDVPVEGMLNKTYLAERASMISMEQDMGSATPGVPPDAFDFSSPQMVTNEGGTSHISIIDSMGNAISMTTTVESYFGSGLMLEEWGFLLNNQVTDFSFSPTDGDGVPIANRVQPSKRPRSSMSPTIVMKDGKPTYLAGSPGGFRIIGYTSKALMLMLDYGYDPQAAANSPHSQNQNGDTELEPVMENITSEYDEATLTSQLEGLGHVVVERGGETSGLSLIAISSDGTLSGGADPRRDGTAGGRSSVDETLAPTAASPTSSSDTEAPNAAPSPAPSAASFTDMNTNVITIVSLVTSLVSFFPLS